MSFIPCSVRAIPPDRILIQQTLTLCEQLASALSERIAADDGQERPDETLLLNRLHTVILELGWLGETCGGDEDEST